MATTCNCTDLLGNRYEYNVCRFELPWPDAAGVYMFVMWSGAVWVPLYIGKAESFRNRLCASHECWLEAVALGATHVLARCVPNAMARATEERRLIEAYDPPLNVHYRRSLGRA